MLKYLTALVAAITPLMYFHGSVYQDSYLHTLGVPPDLFPLSFEDALVQGFMAYMLLSIPALIMLFIYLLVAFGVAYNVNEASKISFVKKIITWLANQFRNPNTPSNIRTQGYAVTEDTVKWVSYSIITVLGILILLGASIGIAIKIENLAKDSAKNSIKGISKNSVLQELHLKEGSLIRGYVLKCSDYGCAIYSDKTIQIIPLAAIETINALTNKSPN